MPAKLDLEPSWIAAAGTVIVGALGMVGLWLANRLMGKAAFQQAINSGFKNLLDEVNADREALRKTLEHERLETAIERDSLRGEIRQLNQLVESLMRMLRDNGIPLPETRSIAVPVSFLEFRKTPEKR